MRRRGAVLLVILLLLIGALGILTLTGGEGERGVPARPPDEAAGRKTAAGEPDLAPAGDPSGPAPEVGEAPVKPEPPAPAAGETTAEGSGGPVGEAEGTKEDPAPAIRPSPRAPPPPKPGVRPLGGSRPPMGPTGLWERFPPERPSGRAILEARILDRDGSPIAGADVYIGPPAAAGQRAVSFGDLKKVGKTDEQGEVRAEELPEGSASVAANLFGLMNGRRGLDMTTAVKVVLGAGEVARAKVTLPIGLADMGAIEGRVLDPAGNPIKSAQVAVGFAVARTGRGGRFSLPHVMAGSRSLSVSRNGYRPAGLEVEVQAGETADVEVALDYREKGTISLTGTVVGPEAEPVADARVYLIAAFGMGMGTIRSAETDEHGRFVMDSLPDRLAGTKVRVQGSKWGYRSGNTVLPEGLESGEVQVVLPVRMVKLFLTVVDASTGAPQTRCRFTAQAEGAERAGATFSSRGPEGRYESWLDPGVHDFTVEAPDHETLTAKVDVGAGGGEFRYTARLVAVGEESVEVVVTVIVTSLETGEPVERARVEFLRREKDEGLATLEGERPGGRFVIPTPSGTWRLRVNATGFEEHLEEVRIEEDAGDVEIPVRLRSR